MSPLDRLTQFLRDAAGREFRLGEWDCGLWLADWYVVLTGHPDPAAAMRGKNYAADALMTHLAPAVMALIEAGKIAFAPYPVRNDVGVLALGDRQIGAICTGTHWAVLGENGLSSIPLLAAKLLYAWRIV